MIMENNNEWFGNIINHQQQTFVTKHDLELLHKKIIATDLIVEKYQESNKALLRLQVENDDLKQRIEQMENECSIFGKQVTECTQESDNLKRQIELIHNEKIRLKEQIRRLQDENTNNQHEIMVLRQFESLKDTNDQLNKTVERKQKMISKLQLQVQRNSPAYFKLNKASQESTEAEIALGKSKKSILELRLALGRLMNFIELSKIEVPSSLLIRPVLKAHDINDNFLEVERIFVHKPVKKKSTAAISNDHDSNVQASIPVDNTAVIESTQASTSKIEKKTRKSRRKKDESLSESLANELEMALAKQNQEESSQLPSLFSDEQDLNQQSDTQQTLNTQSTISFFTDDEISPDIMPPPPLPPPLKSTSTLQVDHLTPMDVSLPEKSINDVSFLSEDEEENHLPVLSQEYISPVEIEKTTVNYSSELSRQLSETFEETNKDSPSNEREQVVETNTINPKHIQVIHRLLNVLVQLPVPSRHLRLVRRRIKPQLPTVDKVREEQCDVRQNDIIIPQQQESISEITGETTNLSEDCCIENMTTTSETSIILEEPKKITESEPPTIVNDHHSGDKNIAIESEVINAELPIAPKPATIVDDYHSRDQNRVTESVVINVETPILSKPPTIVDDYHSRDKKIVTEPVVINAERSIVAKPQETLSIIQPIQFKRPQSSSIKHNTKSFEQNKPSQSLLKPFQRTVINRLLHTLTTLPIKPLVLPSSYPRLKRKRKSVVPKQPPAPPVSVPASPSRPMPITRSSRSLNTIRACIARCNKPVQTTQQKRTTTTEVHTSPISKRRKPNSIEPKPSNSYDLIDKYLENSNKDIDEQLREFLDENLRNHLPILIDRLHEILDDFLVKKCDIILVQVTKLHLYEESIEILFKYIHSRSSSFLKDFLLKLNQKFQFEIQQSQRSNKRIQILTRFLFITCSISSESSVIIYARLFDIAYSLSQDILANCLTFLSTVYPKFLSVDSQTSSSNILLHQILIDLAKDKPFEITLEYLQNLLLSYRRYTHDQEDLLRCFLLIFHYQTWSWCSQEFYKKIFYPLLNQPIDQSQRLIILMILQYILFIYKTNEDFQRDHEIHQQIRQQLTKIKTRNRDECFVREKILSILSTCC